MADIKELDSIIQIDGNEYAVVAEKAEKLANKLTISVKQGDTDVTQIAEFDGSEAKTAIITIPTNVSQLTNDEGYIKSVPDEYITETELNNKGYVTQTYVNTNIQAKLVSGTNIKTINSQSILGSGDITIAGAGGDMLKSVYDTNNNGAVNTSEKVRVTMNNNVTKDATITIKSGDPEPSDGNIGDIWFKYQ